MTPSTGNSSSISSAPARREEKITPRHLERLAMVYVRQSTAQQVLHHRESTEVQYRLKERAQAVGWDEDRVVVIDDDLGKSGATVEGRLGFQRLIAEVTLDHVGAIFGVEMSRLARSCKDWYHLLEVCAVYGTLIADLDGVYDPAQYNDRLLLGLKGTMSEAELHILKQRMNQGRLNKARRGEFFISVPIGYVRRPSGEVALDPDEEAQRIVRLVFEKFVELGTVSAMLRFFVRHGIRLPVRSRCGTTKGELQWRRPCSATLQSMLKHPIYAGAYTFGRQKVDARRQVPGRPGTGRSRVPAEECQVFLKDRLPAYITWKEYECNKARLRANRFVSTGVGAPKRGAALLTGILRCGRCGCRMIVRYPGPREKHWYQCYSLKTNYGEKSCQGLTGPELDEFVASLALRALEPASLELSLEVAANLERQREELEDLWRKRLERAEYEAARAERQYGQVEPENRLVARVLEREWEEKLKAKRSLEEEYERVLSEQPRALSAKERETIEELAADLPSLWASPETTPQDRKEILRQVIDRVVVDLQGLSERVTVRIHWAGGIETTEEMVRPILRYDRLSYWPELSARVRELSAETRDTGEIAARLNADGWRCLGRKERFDRGSVRRIMDLLKLRTPRSRSCPRPSLGEHEWLARSLAKELAMPRGTLIAWTRRGWVRGRQWKDRSWILRADPAELERLRAIRAREYDYHAGPNANRVRNIAP